MSSSKRIQKELLDLSKSPIENASVSPADEANLYIWKGTLTGPSDSPYTKGVFKISIEFPTDYPFKAPKFLFLTKIYHPNVDDDGSICVDILKTDLWKPSTKISDCLRALVGLLSQPNPDDPLQPAIAQLYKTDIIKFNKTVKEWIKKHC